jgi:hypothetical protein
MEKLMSLRRSMEQLRPARTQKIDLQEKVQLFLTEASASTKFSTAMEDVIGACYMAASVPIKSQEAEMKKLQRKFSGSFKDTKRVHNNDIKKCLIFGNKIKGEIGVGGKYEKQASGAVTADWTEWSGGKKGKDTSKTDIVLGGVQCSVKNAAGAQLMSGGSEESKATAEAAAVAINGTKNPLPAKTLTALKASMDELERFTSDGYYASMENLRKLKEAGHDGTLISLLQKKQKEYEKEYKEWKKSGGLKKDEPKDLTKTEKKILLNKDKAKEYKTILKDENAEFMEKVDTIFLDNQNKVKELLEGAFNTKGDYKLAFVHEAATGKAKFGKTVVQYATHVLSWAPTNSLDTFKVSVDSIETRKSSIIKKYAGQVDLNVNWKSSSISKHRGYSLYQNVRLGISSAQKDAEKLEESYHNKIDEYQIQLNEGLITEFVLWDKIKDLTQKFVSKVREIWSGIVDYMRKVFDKIIEFVQEGIQAISNALGFELNVNDSLRNNSSLKL